MISYPQLLKTLPYGLENKMLSLCFPICHLRISWFKVVASEEVCLFFLKKPDFK